MNLYFFIKIMRFIKNQKLSQKVECEIDNFYGLNDTFAAFFYKTVKDILFFDFLL